MLMHYEILLDCFIDLIGYRRVVMRNVKLCKLVEMDVIRTLSAEQQL